MDEERGDIYVPTLWDSIQPAVTGAATLLMNGGFLVALLAIAYLIYGLAGGGLGGFNSLPHAEKLRILTNVGLAAKALQFGLALGTIGATVQYFNEDTLGYALFFGAALIGVGIPYIAHMLPGGQGNNTAIANAYASFVSAAYVPAIVGALLITRDIITRGINALSGKSLNKEKFTYGAEAKAETKPVRTSLIAKCWEGPFCRDFIRPHCPIYLQKKTCWQEKRGCYCEEEIVSAAASKVSGIVLDMAPDPKYNFANTAKPLGSLGGENAYRKPELSEAQKRERCKYCVIYNEHEHEKYKLLVPVVMIGTAGACVVFSSLLRAAIGGILTFTQGLANHLSFTTGGGPGNTALALTQQNTAVEWLFVAALTVMIVSKALQALRMDVLHREDLIDALIGSGTP